MTGADPCRVYITVQVRGSNLTADVKYHNVKISDLEAYCNFKKANSYPWVWGGELIKIIQLCIETRQVPLAGAVSSVSLNNFGRRIRPVF